MPETPIYGFSFETLDDAPGHSLHGGLDGTQPILAEQVESEISRVDDSSNELEDRISLLETTGWKDIVHGELWTANPISIPANLYDMIRVRIGGSISGGAGTVTMQVNQESGNTSLHESAWMTWNPSATAILESAVFTGNAWTIGKWNSIAGSFIELTILGTDQATNLPFSGTSTQVSDTGNVRRISRFSGRLASPRLLSRLSFFTVGSGTSIGSNFRIWIEGHRA